MGQGMTAPDALLALQRDFACSVATLDGTHGHDAAVLARLRSDRGIPARDRLHVYEDAYFARIHNVLREDYGALHAAIGADAFHDLAKLYLMAHPSRSFSLRFAGERLPEFLAGPIAEPFARRWPLAADLAALEWALVDVFDAPDAVALERAALAQVRPEDWAGLRFMLIPAHRLLSLDWPVQRVREAWSAGRALPPIQPESTTLLVHRHGERVFQRVVASLEAGALEFVRDGQDFATLCASVADATSDSEGATLVLEMLERWIAEGLLAAHASPAEHP
jgi:hypothetical protein